MKIRFTLVQTLQLSALDKRTELFVIQYSNMQKRSATIQIRYDSTRSQSVVHVHIRLLVH